MVKPCFIWYHNEVYHVVDIPGYCYGRGSTKEEAVASAVQKGIPKSEIYMGA